MTGLVADTEITIEFQSAEGKIGGSGGCNDYSDGYGIDGNKLTIKPPVGSIMMACPEPVMDQEQVYLKLLGTTETYRIKNGKLIISSSGNRALVFTTS